MQIFGIAFAKQILFALLSTYPYICTKIASQIVYETTYDTLCGGHGICHDGDGAGKLFGHTRICGART